MPLEIKITGEAAEAMTVLNQLHQSLHKPDIETMPIDDLLAVTKRRFLEAGFNVFVHTLDTVVPKIEIPPDEAEAIVEKIEQSLEPKRKKTTVVKKPSAPPETETPPNVVQITKAADDTMIKDAVCKELQRRFADPKQKLKAKAFIDKVAKRNAGIRLSLLDPELFPSIKVEMDAEFATSGNGAGGHHAA